MTKLWSLSFKTIFISNQKQYEVYSGLIRVSQSSIVILCIDLTTQNVVELNANLDVELITNDGDFN
jgi:hypothetical protein